MLQKGKPIPEDLMPVRMEVYRAFVEEVLTEENTNQFRTQALKVQTDWRFLGTKTKLNFLNSFHQILFADFFPQPICKTTYNRVDAAALFYAKDWSMSFTENYLNQNFDIVLKTWIHESYHGFLHFLSLRLDFQIASEVIIVPNHVVNIAHKYPLSKNERVPATLAKRNLIGTMDRVNSQGATGPISGMRVSIGSADYQALQSRVGTGWDSYYLNVEIPVENLTEVTFKKLLPHAHFRRSYTTAEDYIERRFNGEAPIFARQSGRRNN